MAGIGLDIQEELANTLCIDATSRGNSGIVQYHQGAQKEPAPYSVNPDELKKQPSDIAAEFLE
jgi:hypothetical protein